MKIKEYSKTSLDVVSDFVLSVYNYSLIYPIKGVIHFKQKYAYENTNKYEDCIEYFEVIDEYNIEWLHDFCEGQTDVMVFSVFTIDDLIEQAEHDKNLS